MKIYKKILCLVLVMAMSFALNSGAILAATSTVTTVSYALSYDSNSPYNVATDTKTIGASGNDYFKVQVSSYSISVSGGFMTAVGKNYATGSKNFTGTGTQNLVFLGSSIPKKNIAITVNLKLNPYTNYMRVSGNVKR